jgi:methylmalonyl-CoA/ethylmalonyl-CoA epimerase
MMMSDLSHSQIGQIAIIVHDVPKAVAFYRDSLGLRLLFEMPKMAFFDCGGVRLMLGIPETPKFDHPSSILYFGVSDLRETHQTLMARGVEFTAPPHLVAKMPDHELWMAFFRDLDGNTLALMSELR